MNKLVSKKRPTQFARHVLSEREKLVEGVPVTHLSRVVSDHARDLDSWTYLSQHKSVNLCMEALTRAWACSFSMNVESSFYSAK